MNESQESHMRLRGLRSPFYRERWRESVFNKSADGGASAAVILQPWSLVDPTGLGQDWFGRGVRLTRKRLEWQIASFASRGFKMLVNIAPVFSWTCSVPTRLWDCNPAHPPNVDDVVRGYAELIDDLAGIPGFEEQVMYVSIGNEVDLYFDQIGGGWDQYRQIYELAAIEVRQRLPHAKVGVTTTLRGSTILAGKMIRQEVARLNEVSDVLIFTYYPYSVGIDGLVRPDPPSSAIHDFDTMRRLVETTGKPIVLQEIGYPGHPAVHSDLGVPPWTPAKQDQAEGRQAEFVRTSLRLWGQAGIRIPFLSWFSLHDHYMNPQWNELLDDPMNYGDQAGQFGTGDIIATFFGKEVNNVNFSRLFATCGLRRADGSPRPAWDEFVHWWQLHRAQEVLSVQ